MRLMDYSGWRETEGLVSGRFCNCADRTKPLGDLVQGPRSSLLSHFGNICLPFSPILLNGREGSCSPSPATNLWMLQIFLVSPGWQAIHLPSSFFGQRQDLLCPRLLERIGPRHATQALLRFGSLLPVVLMTEETTKEYMYVEHRGLV